MAIGTGTPVTEGDFAESYDTWGDRRSHIRKTLEEIVPINFGNDQLLRWANEAKQDIYNRINEDMDSPLETDEDYIVLPEGAIGAFDAYIMARAYEQTGELDRAMMQLQRYEQTMDTVVYRYQYTVDRTQEETW